MSSNPQTKPANLDCEFADGLLCSTSTIIVYHYCRECIVMSCNVTVEFKVRLQMIFASAKQFIKHQTTARADVAAIAEH